MCPVCIATAAQIAFSATSTGGLALLAVKKLRTKSGRTKLTRQIKGAINHEQEANRKSESRFAR
jgi:tRNA 2-selenouridine synthase SelU